jgi:hypothetical protein
MLWRNDNLDALAVDDLIIGDPLRVSRIRLIPRHCVVKLNAPARCYP